MTRENLQQFFRSFLVKLNSTEAQMLGNDDDQGIVNRTGWKMRCLTDLHQMSLDFLLYWK